MITQFSIAQEISIDSLKLALKLAKSDTTKCNILYQLAENADNEEWPEFNTKLLNLSEQKLNLTSGKHQIFYLKHYANAINNVGLISDDIGDLHKAKLFYSKALKIRKSINDNYGIANSLNNLAHNSLIQGKTIEALSYYKSSLKHLLEIKDLRGIALVTNNIGNIHYDFGDIPTALDYFYRSLKTQELNNHKPELGYSLNNIGAIFDDQGDFNKAIEFYNRSLKVRQEINDKKGISESLNNLGYIYQRNKEVQKGLAYMQRSLKIAEEINDKMAIDRALNNIGLLYFKLGDKKTYLSYLERSLKIAEEVGDKGRIAHVTNNIANTMYAIGKIDVAEKFANRSLKTSKELGFPRAIGNIALTLKLIYKEKKQYKAALMMLELEVKMRDSISNEVSKKASIKKQFQYLYEKKSLADSIKNIESQKVKNAQLAAQGAQLKQEKTQRYSLYGGLLLVISFSAFVYNRFKITQKQKVIIEQQKLEVDFAYAKLHEKNKQITDSIIYARRIQRALITPEKYMTKEINRLTNLFT